MDEAPSSTALSRRPSRAGPAGQGRSRARRSDRPGAPPPGSGGRCPRAGPHSARTAGRSTAYACRGAAPTFRPDDRAPGRAVAGSPARLAPGAAQLPAAPRPVWPRSPRVDLGAAPGDAVLSAGDGVVSWAGVIAGRGVVVVRSGRLRTTYEPVEAGVHRGQSIRRGQPLGTLAAGHPGCTAPACLHWGLLAGERYLDPLSLLRPRVVRLVPPGGRPAAPPAGSSDTSLPTPAPAAVGLGSGSRHASSGYLVPMGVTGAAVAGLAGVSARVWRRRSPAGGPRPPPRRRQCPPRTQRTRRCHAAGPPGDGR